MIRSWRNATALDGEAWADELVEFATWDDWPNKPSRVLARLSPHEGGILVSILADDGSVAETINTGRPALWRIGAMKLAETRLRELGKLK